MLRWRRCVERPGPGLRCRCGSGSGPRRRGRRRPSGACSRWTPGTAGPGRGRLKDGILTPSIVQKSMGWAERTTADLPALVGSVRVRVADWNGRYSFMHTTERTEARIEDATNVLVAPSALQDDGLIRDFCGSVITLENFSSGSPNLNQKTVYL